MISPSINLTTKRLYEFFALFDLSRPETHLLKRSRQRGREGGGEREREREGEREREKEREKGRNFRRTINSAVP